MLLIRPPVSAYGREGPQRRGCYTGMDGAPYAQVGCIVLLNAVFAGFGAVLGAANVAGFGSRVTLGSARVVERRLWGFGWELRLWATTVASAAVRAFAPKLKELKPFCYRPQGHKLNPASVRCERRMLSAPYRIFFYLLFKQFPNTVHRDGRYHMRFHFSWYLCIVQCSDLAVNDGFTLCRVTVLFLAAFSNLISVYKQPH